VCVPVGTAALLTGALLAVANVSATTSTKPTRDSAEVANCVKAANAGVAAGRASVRPVISKTPLNLKKARGKTVFYLGGTLVDQRAQQLLKAFRQAAKIAGLKVKTFDGKGQVALWNQGFLTGVSQHADAIVAIGIDPAVVRGSLEKAKAAGVPVFGESMGDASIPAPRDLVKLDVVSNFRWEGARMADYVLAKTKCKVDAALLGTNLYTVGVAMNNGVRGEFKRLCPTQCELSYSEVDFTKLPTQVPGLTQSVIGRNPNTSWIITFDAIAVYAVTGLQQAHADKVKVISHDGNEANIDLMRKGTQQFATFAQAAPLLASFVTADEILRYLTGKPLDRKEAVLRGRLIDKANLGKGNDTASLFPKLTGLQTVFKKLWGIKP
jgi:ABC-type sugar transport system substrate-binding protein